jgi:hypothetical protein
MSLEFTQQQFNSTLKELLGNYESTAWPKSINRHAFFVALAALQETPRTDGDKIVSELEREIITDRGSIPVAFAIAAKRASKGWVGQRNLGRGYSKDQRARARRSLSLAGWRAMMTKKLNSMVRGRIASGGFIRAGWVGVLKALGPAIGGKYNRGEERNVRGAPKGSVNLATPGNFQVTIENTAAARSEHRGGFHRVGDPALERGLARENNQMVQRIEDEMKPGAEKFNRQQH